MPVAGAFPRIARDFIGAPQTTGSNDDRLGNPENFKTSSLTIVTERAVDDPVVILEQRHDGHSILR